MESSTKNSYAAEGSDRWRERLGGLDVPTLVVHGTEDPLFPLGHGEALAREIPGAELLMLEGSRPRAGATRLGRRRARDPAAHAGIVNVSGCEPSTSVKP